MKRILMIPTGPYESERRRVQKALEVYNKEIYDRILISGENDNFSLEMPREDWGESQRYKIYNELRAADISPIEMMISGGKNSRGNILETIKKFPEINTIDIVSYHQHLLRFLRIINKEKEKETIPRYLKINFIETIQTPKELVYGVIGRLKENGLISRNRVTEWIKRKLG